MAANNRDSVTLGRSNVDEASKRKRIDAIYNLAAQTVRYSVIKMDAKKDDESRRNFKQSYYDFVLMYVVNAQSFEDKWLSGVDWLDEKYLTMKAIQQLIKEKAVANGIDVTDIDAKIKKAHDFYKDMKKDMKEGTANKALYENRIEKDIYPMTQVTAALNTELALEMGDEQTRQLNAILGFAEIALRKSRAENSEKYKAYFDFVVSYIDPNFDLEPYKESDFDGFSEVGAGLDDYIYDLLFTTSKEDTSNLKRLIASTRELYDSVVDDEVTLDQLKKIIEGKHHRRVIEDKEQRRSETNSTSGSVSDNEELQRELTDLIQLQNEEDTAATEARELIGKTKQYISQLESQALFLELFGFSWFNPEYPVKAARLRDLAETLRSVMPEESKKTNKASHEGIFAYLGKLFEKMLSNKNKSVSSVNEVEDSNTAIDTTSLVTTAETIKERIRRWKNSSPIGTSNRALFHLKEEKHHSLYCVNQEQFETLRNDPSVSDSLFLLRDKDTNGKPQTRLYYRGGNRYFFLGSLSIRSKVENMPQVGTDGSTTAKSMVVYQKVQELPHGAQRTTLDDAAVMDKIVQIVDSEEGKLKIITMKSSETEEQIKVVTLDNDRFKQIMNVVDVDHTIIGTQSSNRSRLSTLFNTNRTDKIVEAIDEDLLKESKGP